ncbi:ribosome-inactivating family protein [Streptomyces sp. NPDC004237]|uniref:ribosome-inactivating family protein n=1 Tax=Streptomyces sp. NPDC004237 TaxID=3154455 RepID=UPI0033B185DB
MSGLAATSASTAAGHVKLNAETVADQHVDFPQVHWNLEGGSSAYLRMLDDLRSLARSAANARMVPNVTTSRGQQVNVFITDNTKTSSFADVVITSGQTRALHVIIRLSDFYVVRFYSVESPSNFVLNLAPEIPNHATSDDNWFFGKEGYDALTRVANQALTDVNINEFGFEQSLINLTIRGTDRTAQARSMLRLIIGISEAARFRPIAGRVASGMDTGADVHISQQQVGLMRNWSGISHVFVGRNNKTDRGASTSVAGVTIADIRVAADLLAVALNDGKNPNPKDEL